MWVIASYPGSSVLALGMSSMLVKQKDRGQKSAVVTLLVNGRYKRAWLVLRPSSLHSCCCSTTHLSPFLFDDKQHASRRRAARREMQHDGTCSYHGQVLRMTATPDWWYVERDRWARTNG